MELFEAINSRYSYRGDYLDEKVSFEDLQKIARAGLAAPSGCNKQTASLILVDDEEIMRGIRDITRSDSIMTAPALIAVATDPSDTVGKTSFDLEDCAAAVENMLLAIAAMGYASCWIDGELLFEKRAEKIAKLLHVPGELRVRVLLPIGKPVAEGPRKSKQPFATKVFHNTYK